MAAFSDQGVLLKHGSAEIQLEIPSALVDKVQELVKTFKPTSSEDGDPAQPLANEIEVYASFLEHCIDSNSSETAEVPAAVLDGFAKRYGIDANANDIHSVIGSHSKLDESGARLVLRAFYKQWDTVECAHHYRRKTDKQQAEKHSVLPALFREETSGAEELVNPSVMAMFGGQHGGSINCMYEISWLLDVYGPIVREYLAKMSEFLDAQSRDTRVAQVYYHGLDVYEWICKPDTMPGEDYVRGIAVSLPVVGLTQLMQILVLFRTLGMAPGELVRRFKGKLYQMEDCEAPTRLGQPAQ
ncbi:hypothetical protein GGI11_000877 [Coemansia sp. RSA 2049]|nr:hypothetical protein GGI11_000877 [Coemansia sp. RSA 2049]